jgi:hypothetical protein
VHCEQTAYKAADTYIRLEDGFISLLAATTRSSSGASRPTATGRGRRALARVSGAGHGGGGSLHALRQGRAQIEGGSKSEAQPMTWP